jgi:phosphate transport system permease protein
LTELAPNWVRQPAMTLMEMLAAIPSVILGLWGIFVLVPWLRDHPFPLLQKVFGFLPIFGGHIYGASVLSAGVILAIMIVPIVTSISREVLRTVPDSQREAAFALGATRWEVTKLAVLKGSLRGIFGAAMLGLGRALGETMAVTMVIGNSPDISTSLFAPGYTLASAIANEFTEATDDLYRSALFELGLVLLLVTIVTNILAHLLVGAVSAPRQAARA